MFDKYATKCFIYVKDGKVAIAVPNWQIAITNVFIIFARVSVIYAELYKTLTLLANINLTIVKNKLFVCASFLLETNVCEKVEHLIVHGSAS